jgi:hypothetical protein
MNEDLALFSSHDLIEEVMSRFDHAVFSGLKVQGDELPYIVHRQQVGNILTCIGMCHSLAFTLSAEHEDAGEPSDDEYDDGSDQS